jgi:hypothetical protein
MWVDGGILDIMKVMGGILDISKDMGGKLDICRNIIELYYGVNQPPPNPKIKLQTRQFETNRSRTRPLLLSDQGLGERTQPKAFQDSFETKSTKQVV